MPNPISEINMINVNSATTDKGISGLIKDLPINLQSNFKVGEIFPIKLFGMSGMNASINNEMVKLYMSENIKFEPGKAYEAEAKILGTNNNNLQIKLISIENQKPENFILGRPNITTPAARENAVVINTNPQSIPLNNLKLAPVVERAVVQMNLPEAMKEKIIGNFDNSQVSLNISREVFSTPTANPLEVIKDILFKPASEQNTQLTNIKLEGTVELKNNQTIIKTPFGDITPRIPIKLENGSQVVLNLTEVIKENTSASLNLAPVVKAIAQQLNLPQPIAEKLISSFESAPLQFNISRQDVPLPNVQNPIDTIRNIISQPIQEPVKEVISNLVNLKLEGTVELKDNQLVIKTPLGDVTPRDTKLELGTKVVLELVNMLKASKPQTFAGSYINDILKPLQTIGQDNLATQIFDKFPKLDAKMLPNLISFMKASETDNIETWLGKEVVTQLKASGPEGREVLSRFSELLNNSLAKENPTWRIIEIPFFNGDTMSKIKVATKKREDDDGQDGDPKRQNYGTRFVVDTNFSRLGSFQFDGYSTLKEKRFDLVVRTQNNIDEDLVSNIIRIFKTSLHNMDYVGNVSINKQESFIKIEEEARTGTLKDGIFI